jgi:hypothetical protein
MKPLPNFKRKPEPEQNKVLEPRLVIPKEASADHLLRRYEQLADAALKNSLPDIETEEAA